VKLIIVKRVKLINNVAWFLPVMVEESLHNYRLQRSGRI